MIENVESGSTDVADKIGILMVSVEERFNERASSTFAFGGGDTDDGAGAVVEEIFGDGGFIF